jgi:hypothetical protein
MEDSRNGNHLDQLRRGTELRNMVDETRIEYRRLNAAYDLEFAKAHWYKHGSAEIIEVLKEVNRIGVEVSDALQRYQDAVETQAAFHSNQ